MRAIRAPNGAAFGLALATIVALGTLRAFGHVPTFPFTDADALVDVAWAGRPLSDQLLVPLTGGLGGDNANFWRPLAMLQFWIQRRLFGEIPAGWHAWDVVEHALASALAGVLVLRLARAVGRPDPALALLAALLFVGHPLAEEVVPAVARNLDMLLAIFFFGALIMLICAIEQAREEAPPTRVGAHVAAFTLLGALSLGAKEAGVLLLPIGLAWVALLRDDLPLRARAAWAIRVVLPFTLLVAVWYGVRSEVLSGVGGYRDAEALGDGDLFRAALSRAFLEPLLPSLSVPLAAWSGAPGTLFTGAIWATLAFGLRRHRKLLALLAALYLSWIFLLGVTGTYSRRVLYVPTLAMAGVLALAGVEAVRGLWAGASIHRIAGALGTIALLAGWAHGSPLFLRYTDWDAAGRVTVPLLDPGLWARYPEGATVWLVDRPSRVDLDPRRYRLWSRRKSLANAATSYSLAAWVAEHVPRRLRPRPLTALLLEGAPEQFAARLSVVGNALVVERTLEPQRSLPDRVSRSWTPRTELHVEEQGDALTVSPADPTADLWLLVWDPHTPRVVRMFDATVQIWPEG